MIKWKKKDGTIVKTNDEDASIRAAIDLGWEQVKEEDDKQTKKPKAKSK